MKRIPNIPRSFSEGQETFREDDFEDDIDAHEVKGAFE